MATGAKIIYNQKPAIEFVFDDITERKLAENTLKKSENRFREAMEATNDGLWDWNVETDEAYFSPAYYRMLGYEPGDFSTNIQFWLDHIHPDDRAQAVKVNEDCIENRASNFEVEFRMRTKSGGWKWILGRGRTSARDANGRALRMIGTHQDITERKRLEEELKQHSLHLEELVAERTKELRESEEKYRDLFEACPVSLWEEDFSAVKQFLGELRQKGVLDFDAYFANHPKDLAKCAALVKVLKVNEATLNLYNAKSVDEIIGGLSGVLTEQSESRICG